MIGFDILDWYKVSLWKIRTFYIIDYYQDKLQCATEKLNPTMSPLKRHSVHDTVCCKPILKLFIFIGREKKANKSGIDFIFHCEKIINKI